MVALSLRKPSWQKISWSVLRCIDSLLVRPRKPGYHNPCDEKAEHTDQPLSPVATCNEIESSQSKTQTQQCAAQKPEGRIFKAQTLLDCPPKTAEENPTDGKCRPPEQLSWPQRHSSFLLLIFSNGFFFFCDPIPGVQTPDEQADNQKRQSPGMNSRDSAYQSKGPAELPEGSERSPSSR